MMKLNKVFNLGSGAKYTLELDNYKFDFNFDEIFDEIFDKNIDNTHIEQIHVTKEQGAFTISYMFELSFKLLDNDIICLCKIDWTKQKEITHFKTKIQINNNEIPDKCKNMKSFYMTYNIDNDIFILDIRNKRICEYFYMKNNDNTCKKLVNELNNNYNKIKYKDNQGHGIDCFINDYRVFSTGYSYEYDEYIVYID